MNFKRILLGCAGGILLLAPMAHADVFDTATILTPGHFALGLEPQLTFSPSTFLFNIRGDLGLTRGIDLDLRLGVGSYTFFGANLAFALMHDTKRSPAISFTVGGHGSSNFGLDAILTISKWISTFTLYGALDADFEFVGGGEYDDQYGHHYHDTSVLVPLYVDIGVDIPIARNFEFLLEGNIGVTAPSASGLCGGVKFYF